MGERAICVCGADDQSECVCATLCGDCDGTGSVAGCDCMRRPDPECECHTVDCHACGGTGEAQPSAATE